MSMSLINKRLVLFIFVVLAFSYQGFSNNFDAQLSKTEAYIEELVMKITDNLSNTSVKDLFVIEQKNWIVYRDSHIATLFPEYINNTKMLWGSVISNEIAKAMIQMNLDRIQVLENYLNGIYETGTDGGGKFKEYVQELKILSVVDK